MVLLTVWPVSLQSVVWVCGTDAVDCGLCPCSQWWVGVGVCDWSCCVACVPAVSGGWVCVL